MFTKPKKIIIRRPDDWHVHLRDGLILSAVLPYTSALNGRAMIMPNLIPPISSIQAAISYRDRIMAALPDKNEFTPMMTCYLTKSLDPNELELGYRNHIFFAAKFYPMNVTTNAHDGISNIFLISKTLERMEKIGIPLLLHGEVNDPSVDIFDREARFIDQILEPLRKHFPALKIVMEHITTKESADYVETGNELLGATITPQHLMFNRNHMLVGGLRPHLYCLPILKRNLHQQALRKLVASGNRRVFLGTDTAPHLRNLKESHCGCAGIFNSINSLPAYITVFEELNALEHFEKFCSENGANFYRVPLNKGTVTLVKEAYKVQDSIAHGKLIPFLAGQTLKWRIKYYFKNFESIF